MSVVSQYRLPTEDINDSINVAGLSGFIDGDIKEIERSLVEQEMPQNIKDPKNSDILDEWRKRISSMESVVGISLRDEQDDDNDDTASMYGGGSTMGDATSNVGGQYTTGQQYGGYTPSSSQQYGGGNYAGYSGESRYDSNVQFRDPSLIAMSDEQRKQRILQNALSHINTTPMQNSEKFSFDIEKSNDKKKMLLEQINMLRTNLEDDGIKIADIQVVTTDNTFDEVESVYKQLRYRNDHARYCSFASDFAQMGAYGLEWAFNGEKNYLGFKPDLTGWSSTLNIKMRRLSYETSSLVSDGMREYNIGNFSRICLELIPSLFLHAKMRSNKAGKTSTRPSNNDVSAAIGRMRNVNEGN